MFILGAPFAILGGGKAILSLHQVHKRIGDYARANFAVDCIEQCEGEDSDVALFVTQTAFHVVSMSAVYRWTVDTAPSEIITRDRVISAEQDTKHKDRIVISYESWNPAAPGVCKAVYNSAGEKFLEQELVLIRQYMAGRSGQIERQTNF